MNSKTQSERVQTSVLLVDGLLSRLSGVPGNSSADLWFESNLIISSNASSAVRLS